MKYLIRFFAVAVPVAGLLLLFPGIVLPFLTILPSFPVAVGVLASVASLLSNGLFSGVSYLISMLYKKPNLSGGEGQGLGNEGGPENQGGGNPYINDHLQPNPNNAPNNAPGSNAPNGQNLGNDGSIVPQPQPQQPLVNQSDANANGNPQQEQPKQEQPIIHAPELDQNNQPRPM